MRSARFVAAHAARSPRAWGCCGCSAGAAVLAASVIGWKLVALLAACIVVSLLALVYLQCDWAEPVIQLLQPGLTWRVTLSEKVAALTIDDVPMLQQPTVLEEVLDLLKAHGVRATFFVMSGFALSATEGGPEPELRDRCLRLLRRACEEGHELANHLQFDKPAAPMPPAELRLAFEHCDAVIAAASGGRDDWRGRPWRWFRPPWGIVNEEMLAIAREMGYTTAMANCFPHDPAIAWPCHNAWYVSWRVRPGSVILLHDRWHLPATLELMLPRIAAKGLKLTTLSGLKAAGDTAADGIEVAVLSPESFRA